MALWSKTSRLTKTGMSVVLHYEDFLFFIFSTYFEKNSFCFATPELRNIRKFEKLKILLLYDQTSTMQVKVSDVLIG